MSAPASPVSGGASEYKILTGNKFDESVIIADDQNLKAGTLLSRNSSGEVQQLTNGEEVYAVCKELVEVDTNTYDVKANLRRVSVDDLYKFDLASGTSVATSDIGKFYGVDSNHDIDGDTKDSLPDVTRQFQLVEVLNSSSGGTGVFRIVSPDIFNGGLLLKRTTTITTAQVLALHTTPISLVPAAGAGKYIHVDRIIGAIDYVSAAYATNVTMEFRYTNGSGTKVTADIGALLDTTADKVVTVGGIEAALVLTANAAVVATVATGNPATGDSDVEVTVFYRVYEI